MILVEFASCVLGMARPGTRMNARDLADFPTGMGRETKLNIPIDQNDATEGLNFSKR